MHVEVVAPTMLSRAAVPGMLARGIATIVNVAGTIAFPGPAPSSQMPRRVVYAGTLGHTVAMSQTLGAELAGTGIRVQVECPGLVATEFPTGQGTGLSAVPRMSADDVVTASLRGLELGEVGCAPGSRTTASCAPCPTRTRPPSPARVRKPPRCAAVSTYGPSVNTGSPLAASTLKTGVCATRPALL